MYYFGVVLFIIAMVVNAGAICTWLYAFIKGLKTKDIYEKRKWIDRQMIATIVLLGTSVIMQISTLIIKINS